MAEAIGIDIGGTHIRAARIDANGAIADHAACPTPATAEAVLTACLELAEGLRSLGVMAIGIGVPSRVLAGERRILPGGYVDLSRIGFADAVEAATGLPVAIENDATMALLGEQALGAARGCRNVVMLTIGTGIGGAILNDGTILRGAGLAGQLGHLVVDAPGLPCKCGRHGCLETVSSGSAFGRHLAAAGLPPGSRAEDLLAQPLGPATMAALQAWAAPLGRAIDTLIAACAPERVLLGGGAGAAAVAALACLPRETSWYAAPVVAAELGDAAGMVGAGLAGLRAAAQCRPKRAVLVNGVPASGKSTVAAAIAEATGWPVLALDAIKEPFLVALPPGDRTFNRLLGRASYDAIFSLLGDAPAGSTAIIDAWFGFQPPEVLADGLARAGITETVEIWCEAPPEAIGARYAARVDQRPPGHPGSDYVPELVALAARAGPLSRGPVLRVDTTRAQSGPDLARCIAGHWGDPANPTAGTGPAHMYQLAT
jgi:glucokinase